MHVTNVDAEGPVKAQSTAEQLLLSDSYQSLLSLLYSFWCHTSSITLITCCCSLSAKCSCSGIHKSLAAAAAAQRRTHVLLCARQ
jgi:hypothetical protein